jgi:hypothetical protein
MMPNRLKNPRRVLFAGNDDEGAGPGGEELCGRLSHPPLTSILSPHLRGERKKDAGKLNNTINWSLVSVLKIAFLLVLLAKAWIKGNSGVKVFPVRCLF